jgi:hypothetical protein
MGHVTKYVGGIMETPKMVEESGPVYEIVSKEKQKEAVDFLNKHLFNTPSWLISKEVAEKTGINPVSVIGLTQDLMLNRILSIRTLNKIVDAEAIQGNLVYRITELLGDLRKGIWSELAGRKAVDIYRRNLQKSYINTLSNLINPPPTQPISIQGFTITISGSSDKSDVKSVVRAHLAALRSEINAAAAGTGDVMTKYHLQDVSKRIDNALNPKD